MSSYGFCVGNRNLPIGVGASVVARNEMVCNHNQRKMRVAWTTGLEGTWVPGVHANCPLNEKDALLSRSLGPVPWPDDRAVGSLFLSCCDSLVALARTYCGHKWDLLQTAESYSGSLRRRYLEAERSLRVDGPLTRRDRELSAFLKAEKVSLTKFHKPRMIFPRSPRYNLVLASWLKPFEHFLWGRLTLKWLFRAREPGWLQSRLSNWGSSRVVAKGLSPRQRANLIARKFKSFENCVVFEADGKGFEAHVSSRQLEQEQRVYLAAYRGSRVLRRLLACQMSLSGSTRSGWKFSRPGGRASGDFNTGMGNTLVMLASVVSGIPVDIPFDVLVDGDNALVFLAGADAARVVPHFARTVLDSCGQEMTLETPVVHLEAVRFGQSAPVELGPGLGYTMVRDYRKVLSGFSASHRWLNEPRFGRRWLRDVCRCELSLALGLPVLQTFFIKMLNHYGNLKAVGEDPLVDWFQLGAWLASERDVVPVSSQTRLSFERAFGLSSDDQLLFEGLLRAGHEDSPLVEYPPFSLALLAEPGLLESSWDVRY